MGLGIVLAGCGGALPSAVTDATPPAGVDATAATRDAAPAAETVAPAVYTERAQGQAATGSVVIAFISPRTSFSSDKIELSTGKTLPADDGMGPEGDISFFYDGSRFQAIANSGGGATRTLAPAEAGKATGEFSMAPIPLKEGSQILLQGERGVYLVTISGLQPGSMTFSPLGTGTGTGSVTFSYQFRTPGSNLRI
jgi:hypothetical protein